jgi:hypothetical protein
LINNRSGEIMAKEKIIVSYCMGCGKIKYPHDTEWEYPTKINYKILENILLSHGYCEPCGEKAVADAMSQIKIMKEQK